METLEAAFDWLTNASSWAGAEGISTRLFEHIQIVAFSVALATAVALPLGLFVGHARRAEFLIVSITNLGRAIPSFAIVAIALPISIRLGLGLGFWPTVIALFALAIPPILTNTYVGIQSVEADEIEAARGMGMTGGQILRRLEMPLASPLIIAGFRTATVQVIATATLAALVAWGGLGRYIIDGFATRDNVQILGGAILVAVLAVAAELAFGLVERIVTPQGISTRRS